MTFLELFLRKAQILIKLAPDELALLHYLQHILF